MVDTEIEREISEDFDEATACDYYCRYKREGLSPSSRILVGWLADNGLRGRKVLDLGCGTGSLALETLKSGASSCIGIDLSPSMIGKASELAAENGYAAVSKFQVGNGATADLPGADVVLLDKVICCYPDVTPLLRNAASASQEMIGFVLPRSEGAWNWLLRLSASLMNMVQRIRGSKLNWFYIHSVKSIDATLVESGFFRDKQASSRIWSIFLYRKSQ